MKVRGLLSAEEVERFRSAVDGMVDRGTCGLRDDALFKQFVNNWRSDATLRDLTFHETLHRTALQLAGVPLRLWHDQLLIKSPQKSVPTEFHQDQPYWPHRSGKHSITAWIALTDVPVEKGCLCFIPGSHRKEDLPMQDLTNDRSLFGIDPGLEWKERVVVPLQAGDCTFHHGRTCHMAFSNQSSGNRIGYAVIFIEDGTRYSGASHVVTDGLGLREGEVIRGDLFPLVRG